MSFKACLRAVHMHSMPVFAMIDKHTMPVKTAFQLHARLFPAKTVVLLHSTLCPVKTVVSLHSSTPFPVKPVFSALSNTQLPVKTFVALHYVHRQDFRCSVQFHHTLQPVDATLFPSRKPS